MSKLPSPERMVSNPALGSFLRDIRLGRRMSLRDVDRATGHKVSHAYLSQVEQGKVRAPSPPMLLALSTALGVDYELLMKKAGFVIAAPPHATPEKPLRTIEGLSEQEEQKLLQYLAFLRRRARFASTTPRDFSYV